MTCSKIKN